MDIEAFLALLALILVALFLGLPVLVVLLWRRVTRLTLTVERLDGALREIRAGRGAVVAASGQESPVTGVPEEAGGKEPEAAVDQDATEEEEVQAGEEPSTPEDQSAAEASDLPPSPLEAALRRAGASGEGRKGETDGRQPAAARAAVPSRSGVQDEDRERLIGGRWSVWAGGAALAVGGVFMVAYAAEAGLLGPVGRLVLGALFGLGLAAAGEWLRRRPDPAVLGGLSWASIPAVLTAAGTMVLFAVVYAAHALYGLVGPAPAFLLLGAVAICGLFAALLHGPGLAVLGLPGAYLVPFLVTSESRNLAAVVLYVLAVSAAAVALGRLRRWLWLAGAAVVGLAGYGLLFQLMAAPGDRLLLTLYLAASAMIVLAGFVWRHYPARADLFVEVDRAATLALAAVLLPFAGHLQFEADLAALMGETLVLLALPLAVGYVFCALRYGAVLPLALFLLLALQLKVPDALEALEALDAGVISPLPFDVQDRLSAFSAFMAVCAAGLVATGALALRHAASGAVLSGLAVCGALGVLSVSWLRVESWSVSPLFAGLALALAVVFWGVASRIGAPRQDLVGGRAALVTWLVGAVAALGFAAGFALEDAALTIAFGLLCPAIALVHVRYPLPALRPFAVAAVVPYGLCLLRDPFIDAASLGITPVFNLLLLGYGLPAAGICATAWSFTRTGRDLWSDILQALAIFFVSLTLVMLTLHGIDPVFRFDGEGDGLRSGGLLTLIGGAVSLALARLSRARVFDGAPVLRTGRMVVGLGGMIWGAATLFVFENPALTGAPVGDSFLINWISLLYGGACLLYALQLRMMRADTPRAYRLTVLSFACVAGFFLINLTIRSWFSPDRLDAVAVRSLEQAVYSAVWLAVGLACLLWGLAAGSHLLRKLSAVILVGVTLKAFLIDMSALDGLLRALSFIGLGAVLIGIGALYQRLPVTRRAEPQASGDEGPTQGDA